MMTASGKVWRLVAELPMAVAGVALVAVAAGLVSASWPGTAVLLGWLGLAGLAGSRAGERLLARSVLRGRRPTPAEQAVLAGPISRLCAQGLGPPAVDIWVVDLPGWADGFARRTVLVSTGLISRLRQQRLSEDEATALLVSAVGFARAGLPRLDAPLLLLGLPCLPFRIVAAAIGRATGSVALLVRFSWRMRWLPLTVAAWQAATVHHRPSLAVLTAGFEVVTYLVPVASRRWLRALQLAGDDFAAQTGHTAGLCRFLARYPDDGFAVERLHRLAPPPARLTVVD